MKTRKLVFTFSAFLMIFSLSSCFLTKKKCDCPKFSQATKQPLHASSLLPLANSQPLAVSN
jgi:hypothetical protein